MLTISYKRKHIYINIDLLKAVTKKSIILIFKISSVFCLCWGLLWVIGSAGISDLNIIPFWEVVCRILQGILFCGVAYILNFIKLVIE